MFRCCGYGDLQHLNGPTELLSRGDVALQIQHASFALFMSVSDTGGK